MDRGIPEGVKVRAIPEMNGKYFAGSDGHIYCISNAKVNARKVSPFQLAEAIGSNGYPFVSITQNGKRYSKSVHGLIALAFHGPKPSPVHEVRHIDGSRTLNIPENLAWGTRRENEADKKRHGTASCGQRHGIAKLNDEAVRILRIAIPQGLWNAVDAATVFDVDASVIRRIVAGKSWKHVA